MALITHRPPEEIYAAWDKAWLDRLRVIISGRKQAAIDTSQQNGD